MSRASSEERMIRSEVAARLRSLKPNARIVHELVVGDCRADLAAIERDRVTLVEIKSGKDTLERLKRQVEAFFPACHDLILVLHQKWSAHEQLLPALGRSSLWYWPEPTPLPKYRGQWEILDPVWPEPHAARLLDLLWHAELTAECHHHNIVVSSRSTCRDMIRGMTCLMTGREIAEAVCRQLRQRRFPEADAPILEQARAA